MLWRHIDTVEVKTLTTAIDKGDFKAQASVPSGKNSGARWIETSGSVVYWSHKMGVGGSGFDSR